MSIIKGQGGEAGNLYKLFASGHKGDNNSYIAGMNLTGKKNEDSVK